MLTQESVVEFHHGVVGADPGIVDANLLVTDDPHRVTEAHGAVLQLTLEYQIFSQLMIALYF
jgi:hypothetical protein